MNQRKRARRGRPRHDDILTPAEWRTVHAVQHGMTSRQIARRRGISVDAVKFHVANALDKLGLVRRKSLRTWFAIPGHSALNKREQAMNTELTLGPIGQISRSVKDIEKAQDWYGNVLGLPHLYIFGDLTFFDCGGVRLCLQQEDDPGGESVIYLRVDDIIAAHQVLESRGVEFVNPPHMIFQHEDGTEEWMAFFNDPEGRPLAIMAQVRQP